jgi:hypothetical protein
VRPPLAVIFACLALLSGAVTGCGGSSPGAAPAGSGGAGEGGGRGGAGGTAEHHVVGDRDGVTVRGETQAVAYWFQGLTDGSIVIEGSDDEWTWYLLVTNSETASACAGGYLELIKRGSNGIDGFASFHAGGACTVAVTHAAPAVGDLLEGTFAATVYPILGPNTSPTSITNGRFRVPRIDGQPPPLD